MAEKKRRRKKEPLSPIDGVLLTMFDDEESPSHDLIAHPDELKVVVQAALIAMREMGLVEEKELDDGRVRYRLTEEGRRSAVRAVADRIARIDAEQEAAKARRK